MTRSSMVAIKQPNENTCGPAALKMALTILGKRVSVRRLIDLCNTNTNGTTTRNMIRAISKLRIPALIMQKTTLTHLLSALKNSTAKQRAIIVSYLYTSKPDSGHWAVVSSYKPSTSRIVLLDSYTGKKTSYMWTDFRRRWIDQTLKRRKLDKQGSTYKLIHTPERQLMIVVSTQKSDLPTFRLNTTKIIGSNRVN
jgi:ABC-type bacteriocin/lantibiotic exporter with double-glycine peptidase domain